jgi:hypothetical protein
MPDPILYEPRDVTIALLRAYNITSGHWFLAVQFGLAAGYGKWAEGPRLPAATVPIVKIGLMPIDQPNDISVNAAELSPKPAARKLRSKKRAASTAK